MKYVYCLVSKDSDLYFEQCLLSLYSLRLYHPTAEVVVLIDDRTDASLQGWRRQLYSYSSTIKVIPCPKEFSPKERSRFLKTTIRENIDGTFLFIDCDTIIAEPLDGIEEIDADIAMVPDTHVVYKQYPFFDYMNDLLHQLYGTDVSQDEYYFNSGVMFVRDTSLAHRFFKNWNERWEESRKKGVCTDQQALFKVNHDFGNVIQLLPQYYNCQVGLSVQYLYDAKILHYFNAQMVSKSDMSPFFMKDLYLQVKKDECISEEMDYMIRNCKRQFTSPSMLVGSNELKFLMSPTGKCAIDEFCSQSCTYRLITFILKFRRKLRMWKILK